MKREIPVACQRAESWPPGVPWRIRRVGVVGEREFVEGGCKGLVRVWERSWRKVILWPVLRWWVSGGGIFVGRVKTVRRKGGGIGNG